MPMEMTCENCGKPFYCYPSEAAKGRKYCSLQCRSAHRFNRELKPLSRTPIEFTCQECGGTFIMMQSYLNAYRKKFNRDPLYCSQACSYSSYKKRTDAKHTATCKNCGKFFHKHRKAGGGVYLEQQLCSKQCKNEWVSKVYRQKHGLPSITKRIKRGYVVLRIPASDGKPAHDMLEHRYVMEQFLGRQLLRTETVHHKSGDKTDNRLENLELFVKNHGPGQRVEDALAWATELLARYPQWVRDRVAIKHD